MKNKFKKCTYNVFKFKYTYYCADYYLPFWIGYSLTRIQKINCSNELLNTIFNYYCIYYSIQIIIPKIF